MKEKTQWREALKSVRELLATIAKVEAQIAGKAENPLGSIFGK